jgi:hypothetical protein
MTDTDESESRTEQIQRRIEEDRDILDALDD